MAFERLFKYMERENLTNVPTFILFSLFIIISWNLCAYFIKWIRYRKTLPPGPIGLPFVGYLPFLGSEPHKTLWKMKEKYGDIIGIKFGPKYTIVLNDYSLAKEVINHEAALDRPPGLFNHIPASLGFGLLNGEKWIEQRRFSLSVNRELGLGRSSWEALVTEEVNSFIDELRNSEGNPVDVDGTLNYSITSNIVSLLIGRKLNKNEDGNKVQLSLEFSDAAFANQAPSQATTVIPGFRKLLEVFKIGGFGEAAKVLKNFQEFIRQEVQSHKNSLDVDDFISSYLKKLETLKNSNTRHCFSENMLVGNVSVLFLGANDTIRSSLNWLFMLMAEHKDVQDKIYNEIMDVIGRDGAVKYEERHKIPYTFAVMMEAQRFSSIVPLSTTRKASQDITVRGFVIPKGSEITANLWGLHNDPKYWDNPEKFIPERFLTDGGTKLVKQPPSYVPFSLGRRNCPGETVAWMEILAYFSQVVRNFEISFPSGMKPEYKIVKGLIDHLITHPLCFKERH